MFALFLVKQTFLCIIGQLRDFRRLLSIVDSSRMRIVRSPEATFKVTLVKKIKTMRQNTVYALYIFLYKV